MYSVGSFQKGFIMSLAAITGLGSASIVSNKDKGWKPGGICPKPMPSPQEVMRDRFEKQTQKAEDASKEKPASERNLVDWFNVVNGAFKRFSKQSVKY